MKKIIISVTLTIISCLFVFEIYLANKQRILVRNHVEHFGIHESRQDAANKLGVKVSLNGRWYRELGIKPPKNFPLGTFTNSIVIGFKEGDGTNWPVHMTDRFGYFNKDEWWNDRPELLIVGDSFVTCEHLQSESITGILRRRGVRTVNIGITGTGPVLQLAALKSQWSRVSNSVTRIVWILYEGNDYQDAMEEYEVPEYAASLNPGFHHTPDQSLLGTIRMTDDRNLYGLRYAIVSVATLKRTRLVLRHSNSRMPSRIWSDAISEAEKLCNNITLIRIKKQGVNHDKQWNRIQCKSKLTLEGSKEIYSDSMLLAHLNKYGYEALADLILLK